MLDCNKLFGNSNERRCVATSIILEFYLLELFLNDYTRDNMER